jgi:hypothetical protein
MDSTGRQNKKSIQLFIRGLLNIWKIFQTLFFIFKVPITFSGDPIQYAAFGEAVTIKCRVQANPAAEVSWFKGQERTRIGLFKKSFLRTLSFLYLYLEGPFYTRVNEGLRINRVEMSDNDTFWCRADVLETGESSDFPITVIISSKIFW